LEVQDPRDGLAADPGGLRIAPTRSGVRVRLPLGGELQRALADLDRALQQSGGVRGAAVTVDAAGRPLEVAELREIETLLLERHGAALLQVVEGQREAAAPAAPRARGRTTRRRPAPEGVAEAAPVRAPAPAPAAAGLPLDITPTLLVRRTLRSGQRVRFNGNVVVLGDVNPGAEIVASGDIVVMGTLRGVAHAGATGSAEAIVAAFRLQPVQLRVGSVIGRAPDGQVARPDAPEVARLRDGALVIERFLGQGSD